MPPMRLPTVARADLTRAWMWLALLAGLALRLFFLWRFPFVAPDSKVYEELARNWLDSGVYGLFIDGRLTPVDVRAPGYPFFLAAVYVILGRSRLAVMLAQALVDLLTCVLTAELAARLAPEAVRPRVRVAGLWLAALCPFTANYVAAPLAEAPATFLTALALLFFLEAYQGAERNWFLGGLAAGVGTLVRPETPLLLGAVGLALVARWWRPADFNRLLRAAAWMAAGCVLPLLPWAARNWWSLGRVQFLAPRYAELPGEFVPRGVFAWTGTWLVRYRDIDPFLWKLETEPIRVEDLPASAFDSEQERNRVAALLEPYNETFEVSPLMDAGFRRLARERTARHPLRTYLWIPLARAGTLWLTPRIELLPYTGELWPPGEKWEEDPVDFTVTVAFGLLNLVYLGLALAGAWRCRECPGTGLLLAFVLVRTAFLTQVETPEPRYVLECFPAVLALAAAGRTPCALTRPAA